MLVRSLALRLSTFALAAAALLPAAQADEATIRKNLLDRLPDLPLIDEVSKTPMPGLWEVRVGTELYYSDDTGSFLINGQLIDTKAKANLTAARIAKITAINFADLPLKDAVVWKQGNGSRKLVVFADPNCGYCKKFERDITQVKDVTVYTFLLPILGADSTAKSRDIWCAKDNTKSWRDWMVGGTQPAKAIGQCDAGAIQRNVTMAQKYKLNSTPSLVFEDGKRVPGAVSPADIEKGLTAATAAAKKI